MSEAPRPEKVQKEPTVTKAPPAGRKFPCPQCGARLDFDPSAQGLKCPYCSYHQAVQTAEEKEVLERNYMEFLARDESKIKAIAGHTSQTTCTGCGAVVLLEDKMATEQCPFCHTHLEAKSEKVEGMIEPESVLPFKVDLRGARTAFTRWVESLWFAPNELKKIAALGELTGVYLPYWTYDSMTYSSYSGQRGDNYTDTEYYTETTSDGRTESKSRTVTRIHWYYVSGEVQHFFDDVLVCGSHSITLSLLNDLGEWDLENLKPFEPDYLSSFKTERYSIGLKDGLVEAKKLMEPVIQSLIRRDIGGDHQRIDNKQTRYTGITFKHTLLPIWVAVYRFQNQTYQIVVNGRSGRVSGYRPYSFSKIAGLILGIMAIIGFIMVLIVAFKR
jgi:predicted RNA-binding Zn-ribbon protein involved in translation (DUF1610 family)